MDPVTPSAEVLLEHAQFLRRLARGILHDADAAADVAEDAIVAALGERPTNLRAWLGKVARHLALSRRRADTRRDLRERAAARPEALPSAAEGVARLELQRKVVDAVLALDEPYRSVVVHRFFYGLAPGEIAKRLQVPLETVRTRLRRALEQLRARLDASHGRESWSVALLAIAAPRKTPLGGILAMSVKSKVVAASVLALACVALGVSALARRDGPPHRAPVTQEARRAEPAAVEAAPAPSPAPPPVDFAAIDRDRDVFGIVVDEGGNAVANADVRVIRYPAMGVAKGLAQAESVEGPGTMTASDGSFALRVERGEEVDLRVKAAGFVELQRRWCPAGGRVRILMRKGVSLRVRATGPDGQPLAGAHVVMFKGRAPEMEVAGIYVFLEGLTDERGTCVLEDLLPAREVQVAAWHAGLVFPKPAPVQLPATGEAELELKAEQGRELSGRVTDAATGAPVEGAIVNAYPMVVPFASFVRTDADGRYRLGGWGSERALFVHAKGYATAREEVGEGAEIDVALKPGFAVTGVVRDASGAPVAGAFVGAMASDRTEIRETWTDAEGRFELRVLARARTLVAAKPGFARVSMPIEGDSMEVVLAEGRRLEGRVIGADGQVAEGCVVTARATMVTAAGAAATQDGTSRERHTDDLGRFRFTDLPPGSFGVSARNGDRSADIHVTIGEADVLDVELRFEEPRVEPGHQYAVQVVDDAGRPVAGVLVRSIYQPQGNATDAQGRATLEMHKDVDVDQVLVSKFDGRYAQPPAATYRPGDGDLRIVLREAASVSGQVLLEGKPLGRAVCMARGPDGFPYSATSDQEGRFLFRVPARTRIDVVLTGQVQMEMLPIYGELTDVAAGSEGLVLEARRVPLDRTLVVRVVTPDGKGVPDMQVFPHDARGWRPREGTEATDASGRIEFAGLPAAEFLLRLHSHAPAPWAQAKPYELKLVPNGQEVVFTLREGKAIRGTVRKPDGAGAASGVRAWRGEESVAFARSRDDGTFVLYVAAEEPDPVRLVAYGDDGLEGEALSVAPGAEGVVIGLRPR